MLSACEMIMFPIRYHGTNFGTWHGFSKFLDTIYKQSGANFDTGGDFEILKNVVLRELQFFPQILHIFLLQDC
jgi:hypothetical protein